MDDAGGLGRLHSPAESPGTALVGTGREERLQIQQFIGRFNQTRHARLLQADLFEEHLALLVLVQLGDVGLGSCGDDQHLGPLVGNGGLDGPGMFVTRHGALLIDVADVEHRFVGQQVQVGDQLAVLFLELHGPGAQPLLQDGLVLQQDLHRTFGLLVPAHDSLLLGLGKAVLDGFEVLELQLGIDDTLVAHRVDRTIDMGNVIVLETTEHMNNGVRVADVGQKLVAQPLAFRGTFHQSGDIDDLDGGGHHPLGIVDLREPNKPLIGNGDDAHVGFDRTERKIRRLRLSVGQAVEKGRFTHVGQPHDTTL